MATIRAGQALLPDGWARDVAVTVGADGRIASVARGGSAAGTPSGSTAATRAGVLLPAPANSHSHAFQRAIAGLTERRGAGPGGFSDSFWTWRELMYRFVATITPDQVQAIAAFVQMEMLEAGFGTNVEFHYLHHGFGGQPYDNLSEMSDRIAAAAPHNVAACSGRPSRTQTRPRPSRANAARC